MYRFPTLISYLLFRFILAIFILIQSLSSIGRLPFRNSNERQTKRHNSDSCILKLISSRNNSGKKSHKQGEVTVDKTNMQFFFARPNTR